MVSSPHGLLTRLSLSCMQIIMTTEIREYMENKNLTSISMVYDHDDCRFRDQDEEEHGEITSDVMNCVWYLIHEGIGAKPKQYWDLTTNIQVRVMKSPVNPYEYIVGIKKV